MKSWPGNPWNRLRRVVTLVRPGALAEHLRFQAHLPTHFESLMAELEAVRRHSQGLAVELAQVVQRERQLRAVLEADAIADERVSAFRATIDETALATHAHESIAKATLRLDPFPHCVVDNLLPKAYDDALIAAIPPVELFSDRAINKQQLRVPFGLAPKFSKVVWTHMADVVAGRILGPAFVEKFREPLTRWLRRCFPAVASPLAVVDMHCSDGRIMLRRPGYRILPHRDPKWGFITCLVYLARPGDDSRWGTQLFRVKHDGEAPGTGPHWIAPEQCHCEADIEFLPNRALVMLNSTGAHAAHIPTQAQPADFERYTYQFRIGPTRRSMEALRSTLPPERQALWAGKLSND